MRVFWPQDCLAGLDSRKGCLIVGWKSREFAVAVTALPTLEVGLTARLLEQDTLLEKSSAHQLYAPFHNKRLSVLGLVKTDSECKQSPEDFAFNDDWFVVTPPKGADPLHITIRDEICPIVIFNPPNPAKMHYFTLDPINLYPCSKPALKYPNFLDFHTQGRKLGDAKRDSKGYTLPWTEVLAQMNCVCDLKKQITAKARTLFADLERDPNLISQYYGQRRRSLSFSDAAMSVKMHSRRNIVSVIMQLRSLADRCLTFMEMPLLPHRSSVSLRDFLCTFQQLHLRLNQFCYLPHQYITIVGMNSQKWHYLTPQRNEAYIQFYNMLWLALYDWILGAYLWSAIVSNEAALASMAFRSFDSACDMLVVTTRWLMMWPGGLKLNTQLAQFMGEVIIWSILAWRSVVVHVLSEQIWQSLIHAIALSGLWGGAALQLSVIIDLLYILGLQLGVLYQSLARIHNQQVSTLIALFRVFRGRKFNVLRNRVDSGNYDMHQLLMGTVLFTVLLFLFPTFVAFYSVLAGIQLGVLILTAFLGVALAILNYFPLFPLLLRIRAPQRLPTGVRFTTFEPLTRSCSCLRIQSQPMRVADVFAQLWEAISRFVRESFHLDMLRRLLVGEVVRIQPGKVYRGLYSILPSHRGASSELLEELGDYWGESL